MENLLHEGLQSLPVRLAMEDDRVVALCPPGILIPPVPGLGLHKVQVIRVPKGNLSGAARTSRHHHAPNEVHNVQDFGARPLAMRLSLKDFGDGEEELNQRLWTASVTTKGFKAFSHRADSVDINNHPTVGGYALKERLNRLSPPLTAITDNDMHLRTEGSVEEGSSVGVGVVVVAVEVVGQDNHLCHLLDG